MISGKYVENFSADGKFEKSVPVSTDKAGFFRVEVYTAQGKPLVFSNPIYFASADAQGSLTSGPSAGNQRLGTSLISNSFGQCFPVTKRRSPKAS